VTSAIRESAGDVHQPPGDDEHRGLHQTMPEHVEQRGDEAQ